VVMALGIPEFLKGDMVKITSRRGYIKAVAVFYKRTQELEETEP